MDRRAPFAALLVWLILATLLWGGVAEVGTPGQGWLPGFRDAGGAYALFRAMGYLTLAFLIPPLLGRRQAAVGTRVGGRMQFYLLGLLALAAIQLIPLPTGLFGLLAPAHAEDVAALLPERGWTPITTDPGYTGRAVVHLFLLLSAALVVYHTVRTPRRAWILIGTIIGVGALGAAYGVIETEVLTNEVLGVPKQDPGGGVSGTFFYPNNFAAFAAAALGLAGAAVVRAFRGGRPLSAGAAAMALVILAVALLLSRSRAGLAAGGFALAAGIALNMRSKRVAVASFVLVLLGMGAAGFFMTSLRERFSLFAGDAAGRQVDMRTSAWKSSLKLAAGRPVLGAGLGAYRRAIHLTQSDDTPEELYFAHSDPLNLLAEGGAVGLLLGLAIVVSAFAIALRLSRDREHEGAGPAAACTAALVGYLLMSLVDFPMQIPATSLLFICLAFLPVALKSPEPKPRPAGASRLWLARLASVAGLSLLLLGVGRDMRQTHDDPGILTEGEHKARVGLSLRRAGKEKEAERELRAARELQPFEGMTRYHLAATLYNQREDREAKVTEARREIRGAFRVARGRAGLLFQIGKVSSVDPLLGDLTAKSFREASALSPGYFPRAIPLAPPEILGEIVPEDPALLDVLGRHYATIGRHEDALEAFLSAVRLGGRGQLEKRLAAAYRKLDREADGKREFEALGIDWPE